MQDGSIPVSLAPDVPECMLEVLRELRRYDQSDADQLLIKAYRFAEQAHQGQTRRSGEPYITHPVAVAKILAELELQPATLAAGLLHDVIEDTHIPIELLRSEFGEEVAFLVQAVTNVSGIGLSSYSMETLENLRRMLVATARDERVVIIKLCDRLHNMRTIRFLPREKQIRIANGTLNIFAPLSNRMGMAGIKWELEDRCLAVLNPEIYDQIRNHVVSRRVEREAFVRSVVVTLEGRLKEEGIEARVFGRAKHFYSIYEKMKRDGRSLEQIYDLIGLRVLTNGLGDCYGALSAVHSLWPPEQSRIKDYIHNPKPNGYKSLHTTVFGPNGRRMEVQIRTHEMDRIAETGIAAHWRYKEKRGGVQMGKDARWLQEFSGLLSDAENLAEVENAIRVDLFADEIYVYTPKGDIIRLPKGSTPVDLAFRIHTELGLRTSGALVDGKYVPLSYELKTGDRCEIVTSGHSQPHPDWLLIAKTSRARSKIRKYLQEARRDELVEMGRLMLSRELTRVGKDLPVFYHSEKMAEVLKDLDCSTVEELWLAVGFGRIGTRQVIARIVKSPPGKRRKDPRKEAPKASQPVAISEVDGVQYRRAHCCNPLPGEPIVGIVTKGRGISIHRLECLNIQRFSGEEGRRIPLHWETGIGESYDVILEIQAVDRTRLLADISAEISSTGTNIVEARTQSRGSRAALHFTVQVLNYSHLDRIIQRLVHIDGVRSVTRKKRAV